MQKSTLKTGLAPLAIGLAISGLMSAHAFAGPDAYGKTLLQSSRLTTEIGGSAGAQSQGVILANMAAGTANEQTNSVALANDGQQEIAPVAQNAGKAVVHLTNSTSIASISSGAFQGASGVLGINQAAGESNSESNQFTLATGIVGTPVTPVPNSLLASSTAGPVNVDKLSAASGNKEALSISSSAFEGAHGVALVTQVAGSGNHLSNSFALNVQEGALP